jgi:predicted transcriptional regulator
MAAEDNLSKQLFHGSIEDIREGATITPRLKGGWAFATQSIEGAVAHTQTRLGTGMGVGDKSKSVSHGKIYEVEPMSKDTSIGASEVSGIDNTVASRKGFKVKRQVASVLKNA